MDPLIVITTLASLAKDNPKAAGVLLLWIVLSLLTNLALAKKTQIDAWAESRPRVAGVLKIVRGAGLDPWLILQGLSLLFYGKLPEKLRAKSTTLRPPPPGAGGAAVGLACLALLLLACGPDPDVRDNTPEGATVVILAMVDQDDGVPALQPVCGGVALAEHEFVTVDHCCIHPTDPPSRDCVLGDALSYVDSWQWNNTGSGKATARLERVAGGLAYYSTADRLPGVVLTAAGADGSAELVHVVGSDIVAEPTVLVGDRFDIAVHHGDSGFGFFQGTERRLVGMAATCDAPNPDNGTTCLPTGGRFTPVAQ